MKANANQLRTALDRNDRAYRLYLLHGPDEAGAREWVARLARAMGPEAERIDIEGSALRSDPGLLATEAASLSLFGGARYVRLTGAGEESVAAIELLLAAERAGNPVIALAAPGLKASSKLVKLALAAPAVLTLACYVPEGAEATQLAVAIAAEHGLRASPGVAQRLVAAAGGDRAILTREIEKLALYLDAALDHPQLLDDAAIDAVGADIGDGEIGPAVDAAIAGDPARLGAELARLSEAGVSMIPLLRGLVRRLMAIAELRGEADGGANANDAMERHRVHFREKTATARAIRAWSPVRLARAIERLRLAERAQMAGGGTVVDVAAAAACLDVARSVAR